MRDLAKRIELWLWWKAYKWVFSTFYDIRAQVVRDRLNKEWRDGYQARARHDTRGI